jgi:esterase/lipase superfamily enzyme
MRREYRKWNSPALNREMELLIYGHSGSRVLVFPTSMGKFYEWESHRIEQLKNLDIILTTAWDDPVGYSTENLSQTLWSKGIWHAKRVWDGWAHDWPWWHRQLQMYLGGHD